MATHSSTLAWRIQGTGEPGRLPCMGSHRVGHDWSHLAAAAAAAGRAKKSPLRQLLMYRTDWDAGDGVGRRGHKADKVLPQGTQTNTLKTEKGEGKLETTLLSIQGLCCVRELWSRNGNCDRMLWRYLNIAIFFLRGLDLFVLVVTYFCSKLTKFVSNSSSWVVI